MPQRSVTSRARQRLIQMDTQARAELSAVCDVTGESLVSKHDEAVSDWEGKPKFSYIKIIRPDFIGVNVIVYGRHAQKFKWVNEGTKGPYPIPKFEGGKLLRFRRGNQPHTLPVAKHHQGSGMARGGFVSKKRVMHPGITARRFTEVYEAQERPLFRKDVEAALKRGVRKAK